MTGRGWTTRILAATIAAAIAAAGCKSKDRSAGGGGGGTASSVGTPTGAPTIALTGGGDASAYTVTVRAGAVPAVQPYQARLDGTFETLATVELGPDGTELDRPAIVTVPVALPAGRDLSEVVAALVSSDGTVEDAKIVGTQAGAVQVEVSHFSFLTLAIPVMAIVAIGTMAVIMRGVTEPIMRRDCAKWIAPEDPKVQALVGDPARFSVDTASGRIALELGKPLRGTDVEPGTHARTVAQVIAAGEGDCVGMSTLFGSLLAAKRYPVRTVAGTATYVRGGKTYKGLHQWIETVIDGKGYYVDAFDPANPRLIPLDAATTELRLERNRMCGKNPDGRALETSAYDPRWVDGFAADPLADKKRQLEVLKAEHRRLNDACIAGKAGACSDRQDKYEEAKALQNEINAAEGR